MLNPATRAIAETGLRSYSTSTLQLVKHTTLKTDRGTVRMEGLAAVSFGGRGYLWTGYCCAHGILYGWDFMVGLGVQEVLTPRLWFLLMQLHWLHL